MMVSVAACGGGEQIVPELEEFVLAPEVEAAIEQAAEEGKGAEGTYTHDHGTGVLVLNIDRATFACEIEAGGQLTATITELTATTMKWDLEDGDATWMRVDSGGTGVVGVWEAVEEEFYLVIYADGSFTLVGAEVCDDARPQNGDGCSELHDPGQAVVIDGQFDDWDAFPGSASLEDAAGDHLGDDPGADLHRLYAGFSGGQLVVFTELNAAPSEAFQAGPPPNGAAYRLHLRTEGGQDFFTRVAYNPGESEWQTLDPRAGFSFAVGANGIEWAFDLASFSESSFSIIRYEAQDCGNASPGGSCVVLDETDRWGFLAAPGN